MVFLAVPSHYLNSRAIGTDFNIRPFSREGIPMNNKKCPNCGFINFLSDETCRKCETSLDVVGNPETYGQQADKRNRTLPKKAATLL